MLIKLMKALVLQAVHIIAAKQRLPGQPPPCRRATRAHLNKTERAGELQRRFECGELQRRFECPTLFLAAGLGRRAGSRASSSVKGKCSRCRRQARARARARAHLKFLTAAACCKQGTGKGMPLPLRQAGEFAFLRVSWHGGACLQKPRLLVPLGGYSGHCLQ
jgi:hypothetical protein